MLLRNLADAADRIEVGGSIRRGKPDVGDIELVAVPRLETVPDGLFESVEVNRLTERVDRLIGVAILASHPTDPKRGERYSKLIHPASGLQVDLFSASAESFGLIYLIRTGPATYSQQFVTDLRRKGLHVGKGQLHRGGLGCGAYVCEVIPTPRRRMAVRQAGATRMTGDTWPLAEALR
jgi:DNA polymerase/3'-5' exonuclease PolX